MGIIIGVLSFFSGFMGGGISIIFGGLWILLGLRLLKFNSGARRAVLALAVLFLLVYLFIIYIAETEDHYLYISVILQAPLATLNLIALIYLSLPKIKQAFLSIK